jgi:hypothetical protein
LPGSGPAGPCHGNRIERGRRTGYHEPWFSFRIAVIAFPVEIIQHAIWLYLRFTLSYRDVEELLAERGLDVSYETVRRWVLKFGPLIAQAAARPPTPERAMAPRRDGRSDRWEADVPVARRRP